VEQEDTVYPMIVPGAALHEMIPPPVEQSTDRNGVGV